MFFKKEVSSAYDTLLIKNTVKYYEILYNIVKYY